MSTQPGCIAWKATRSAGRRSAQTRLRATCGALRVGVEAGAVEGLLLELKIVGPQAGRVHAARGDGDHPRRRSREQGWEQQRGEQEWAEDVRRERQLDAVRSVGSLPGKHAGVVDEEIETVEARLEALGEPPHLREIGEVAELELDGAP